MSATSCLLSIEELSPAIFFVCAIYLYQSLHAFLIMKQLVALSFLGFH